jgi:hypothetical protein
MADKITTICAAILDAIAADNAIAAYVTANFPSKTIQLYLGIDVNALPDEAGTPWCAVVPQTFGVVDEAQHQENAMFVTCSIKKEGTTDAGNYTQFDGLLIIDGLSVLIQNRVNATVDQLSRSTISIDLDYPYFRGSWNFTVPTAL